MSRVTMALAVRAALRREADALDQQFEEERRRIEKEIRHAWNTAWPPGDSWIKGYAEDCQRLLSEIDRLRDRL